MSAAEAQARCVAEQLIRLETDVELRRRIIKAKLTNTILEIKRVKRIKDTTILTRLNKEAVNLAKVNISLNNHLQRLKGWTTELSLTNVHKIIVEIITSWASNPDFPSKVAEKFKETKDTFEDMGQVNKEIAEELANFDYMNGMDTKITDEQLKQELDMYLSEDVDEDVVKASDVPVRKPVRSAPVAVPE